MLVGTWDDVYITVHVVCPVCRSSAESSNGCQCGSEDGESKLASDVRHGVTMGPSTKDVRQMGRGWF